MQTDEALHYLEQAMELYRQLGERRYQAIAINALGFLNLIRGNLAVSENLIKESIHLLQEIKDRALLPYALLRWGDLHLEQGRYAEAERIYYEAFDICKNVHLIGGQKAALKRLGELYYMQRKYRLARRVFKEACELSNLQGTETPPPIERAWYALLNGSLDEAESILIQHCRWMKEHRAFSDICYILELFALILEKRKLFSHSIKILKFSLSIRKKYQINKNIKYIKMKIARLNSLISTRSIENASQSISPDTLGFIDEIEAIAACLI
ncbi:hypothetical protein HRbin15_01398 [bacterium HR15]|nr:hypothetical protein HRbin15_01398 [bacterium HR15]